MAALNKILYIFDASDWRSRIPVAMRAKNAGFEPHIAVIGHAPENSDLPLHILDKPHGVLGALNLMRRLHHLIHHEKPALLHAVTIKYAFIAAIAALPAPQTYKIFTLAGLGYLFHGDTPRAKILRSGLTPMLRFLFTRPRTILIFQNPDDLRLLTALGLAKPEQCRLIRGSGVDLSRFHTQEPPQNPPLILMPTRLVREKGIEVFIEAARQLTAQNVDAYFQIAGGETTHNPRAISTAEMKALLKNSPVEWLGRVEDIPALLARATLIVYPSYYGEGIPRVLLEACAAGRPIITTDHTGCREAVIHGDTGLLVPVRDAKATAHAILELLNNPEKRAAMGRRAREKAEAEFDIHTIAAQTVAVYSACRAESVSLSARSGLE